MSKKRVLIIGVGSAGMSFANQLAEHPEKFDVSLINSIDRCSRQAFSIFVDKEKYGATWFNQGVQGGSPVFHHTFRMFERQGYQVSPVKLQVSFGKDIYHMILPNGALFLGTGNATPDASSIIFERLFTSPTYDLEHRGVHVRLSTELTEVIKRDKQGVQVKLKPRKTHNTPVDTAASSADEHTLETVEEFEELVLCVLPNQAKILLGKTARWIDKFILENLYGQDERERCNFGQNQFKAMYYIKEYKSDPRKLEMCFDFAAISRMTAAYRLGADYPDDLEHDDFARVCFR
ncbi:unnamed protein product [Rotaria sp. Silwood1]|nr:unnamed protein product [Rotaria sp. Silwood1]CAF4741404.1 unnamed protein product [Rotaria sp. Silwood1]CAF4821166.1 unnamed protein product [Rotaria sp. Silwood1]